MKITFPYYKQLDAMDCGPTALRMVAKYYGKAYSLQFLREKCYIDREGVSLKGISEAAENIGFRTLAVKIPFSDKKGKPSLREAPLPTIVHWNQNHFVVVYKISYIFLLKNSSMKDYKYIVKRNLIYMLVVMFFYNIGYGQEHGLIIKDKTTEVNLKKSGKPKSVIPYNQWVLLKPEIKTWKMRYGTYKDDSVDFNVGIFDKNKNASFTDIDEDILFVGSKTDSLFEYTSDISSRATVLKINNYLNYNDLYNFKISQENENVLVIEKVSREDQPDNLVYFDKLPNENLKLLNGNKTINLRSLVNGKPIKLIFWSTYCIPCFEEMDMINKKKMYESYNIVSLFSDGNIQKARLMIKERKYPWLFLQSNEKIKRIFSQNGFPYIVDFSEKGIIIK